MGSIFSKGFIPDELPDLSGKVVIVTGGNTGIGFSVIQHLARHGAKVYMAARNEERAKGAITRLHVCGLGPGNGEVVWLPLDYADPRKARQAAELILEKETRLDIVVNSAALLLTPFIMTSDGIQEVVIVNYISPFVFIRTLLPLLKQTAEDSKSDVRIVDIASNSHHRFPEANIYFRKLQDFNPEFKDTTFPSGTRYKFTKLMCILYTKELQRRLAEEGSSILVMSVHPGFVYTDGARACTEDFGPIFSALYTLCINVLSTTPEKGAYSTVFAAASPLVRKEEDKFKGAYIVPPGKVGCESVKAQDPGLARELWETTERVLIEIGV